MNIILASERELGGLKLMCLVSLCRSKVFAVCEANNYAQGSALQAIGNPDHFKIAEKCYE